MTPDLVHRLIPLLALGLNLVLLSSTLTADRNSRRNRFFAALASALALWNLGVFGLRSTGDPSEALAWERFLHLGVIPIPVLFYHYVLVFLDAGRRRRSLIVGYLLCGFFLAVSPTPAFMTGVRSTYWGFAPAAGPLYVPFFIYFQTYLVGGLVWLCRAYWSVQSSFRKNRTLLVISGGAVSVLGGVVDFSRFIFGWEWLYPVGIPSNAVFALALGVALVRYRLIDLGILAKRSVLYLLTTIALAPVLFLGLYVVDHLTSDRITPGDDLSTSPRYIAVLLLGLTVVLPLLRKLEGLLDRLMFARQHGVRDALVALSKEMSSILEIRKLGEALTAGLVTRIPVMHASFHLPDPATQSFVPFSSASFGAEEPSARLGLDDTVTQWLSVMGKPLVVEEAAFQTVADARTRAATNRLEAARVALLLPLFVEGELTAILVVGEKLSGEIFDSNEIQLLETLVEEAAIALQNSRHYEDLLHRMEELRKTQEQLIQSAKLAAVGELATSVAHEINNPLTAVLFASELLIRQTPRGSPLLERLSDIETSALRAAKIVRQLLDLARRREPVREPLSVHEVILRSCDLLQPRLSAARIELQTVFDPAVPLILGDRDQLTQVFINLLTNSADAMPAGGSLTVRTELRQHEGARYIGVSVADTGIGMEPEQLARIFEPFYTTKPEGRGTGLGLSVSLGIVRRHGGAIEAESKLGKGTTMMLKLPLPS